jgi:hypothetical protein
VKRADLIVTIVFIAFIFGLTAADLIAAPVEISIAERRKLAQRPTFSFKRALEGRFASDYARFLQDQIVFRDDFRAFKASVELGVLRTRENNGVYVVDSNLYDKFYGINQRYIERAADLINGIIAATDADRVYLSVIPSKAQLLVHGRDRYLLSDQNAIAGYLKEHVNASYIHLMNLFAESGPELYYRTDHHWTTQGAIQAYKVLVAAMGFEPVEDYDFDQITDSYVGSNYGKAALRSIAKDSITLAHNAHLDRLTVCRYETADRFECFDSAYFREKAGGLDPYDVFLGGAAPIIVIENDRAQSRKELVVFKDSYAHALAPFLAQHYARVTLFDLRYVRKAYVLDHFDLSDKALLFLYSTTILNTDPQILN